MAAAAAMTPAMMAGRALARPCLPRLRTLPEPARRVAWAVRLETPVEPRALLAPTAPVEPALRPGAACGRMRLAGRVVPDVRWRACGVRGVCPEPPKWAA